ncbi:MAG TPA: DMT family transporter [Kaistiaceae bacterium]|nr:DMT family transporter [Kaistiaceae bacterium]
MRRPADWLELSVLVVAWGSSFALTKVAVGALAPQWVAALRIAIGAALLVAIVLARGGRPAGEGLRRWLWCLWLGAVGNVAPFFLIAWGTQYIASGLAGILMAAVPLVVITLAHFLLPDEPMTARRGAGFLVGFLGVVFLIGPDALGGLGAGGTTVLAELAILAATVCYALMGVTARRAPPMDPIEKSAGVLVAAAVLATVLAMVTAPAGLSAVTPASATAVVVLGVLPTAIATVVLFRLLHRAGAGFVSLSNYLIPAFAVVTGIVFLGERLAWQDAAGFALLVAGLALAEARRGRR